MANSRKWRLTASGRLTELSYWHLLQKGQGVFGSSLFLFHPQLTNLFRAKLNGWDVTILSDQWTIRAFSSEEAWKPGQLLVQAPPKPERMATQPTTAAQTAPQPAQTPMPNLPPEQQSALALIPEPQRNLVIQLMSRTNLNANFAVECLQNNGWDPDRALANFEQVKVSSVHLFFLGRR